MQKVIFQIATKSGISNDGIPEHIIESLQSINPKSTRKKLVACSIELIQNNIKHNPNYSAKIFITQNSGGYVVTLIENITKRNLETLENKIKEINQTQIDQLKQIYNQNLKNSHINTGNGLILCKLKSTKNICLSYSETSSDLLKVKIDITFEIL